MKTKVVQHVLRINLSYFKFQIFSNFQFFSNSQIFSGSQLLSDFQTFFLEKWMFKILLVSFSVTCDTMRGNTVPCSVTPMLIGMRGESSLNNGGNIQK